MNEDISVTEFRSLIADFIKKSFNAEEFNSVSSDEIDKLYKRNKSSEWIYPNREYLSKYSLKFRKRYDFGSIEICFIMKNETVESVRIYGDFFESRSICELEDAFKNKTLDEIKLRYKEFKIENYIHGMSDENFLDLLENNTLPENNI